MKTKSTLTKLMGLASFFVLTLSFESLHAQILSDDFNFSGSDVTAEATGAGWAGNWAYDGEAVDGVNVGSGGYIYSTHSGGVSIKRFPNAPVANNNTDTVWYSFLAEKTASGSFALKGHRSSDGLSRFGLYINVDGSIGAAPATASPSEENESEAGLFKNETTYFVVAKYWFKDQKGHMNVVLFDESESIPTDTSEIVWDLEAIGRNTGVLNDYYSLNFTNPAFLVDEFRFGTEWADVTSGIQSSDFDFVYPTPSAPSGLTGKASSETSVVLSWADNSFGEDGYKILQNDAVVATVTEGASFELTGLTNLTSYNFGVFAFTGEEHSDTVRLDFFLDFIDRDITILEVTSAPTVDGTIDDSWDLVSKNRIESLLNTEIAPESPADFEATWSAMWDNYKLYFLFEITDQTLVFNDGSGSGIGQDDGFDFMLAPEGVDGASMVNRLNIVNDGSGNTFRADGPIVQNAETAFEITETGYVMEIAILWSDFDSNIDPFDKAGYSFGADIRYNDDDGTNGGNRDGQYSWGDKNVEGWVWNSNAFLGKITLSPAPGEVLSVVPNDGAVDVPVASDLVITFSATMNAESIQENLSVVPSLANVEYSWDEDSLTLTVSADDLLESTTYTVTIGEFGEDFYGNQLETDYDFSFTTGVKDVVAPSVSNVSPSNGAEAVELESDVVIEFSEAMDKASVESSITISPSVSNVSYEWDTEGKVVTVYMDDLEYNTTYSVVLSTDVSDISGNKLEAEFSSDFTTISPLGIKDPNFQMKLSPNPSSDYVMISLPKVMERDALIEVLNLGGQSIVSKKIMAGNKEMELNVSNLKMGIYLIRIKAATGTYLSKMVID